MEPQGKGSVLNAVKTRGKGSASRFPTRRPDPGVRVDHIDRAYAGANAAQPAAALPLLHPPREYQAETGLIDRMAAKIPAAWRAVGRCGRRHQRGDLLACTRYRTVSVPTTQCVVLQLQLRFPSHGGGARGQAGGQ